MRCEMSYKNNLSHTNTKKIGSADSLWDKHFKNIFFLILLFELKLFIRQSTEVPLSYFRIIVEVINF